jgi:Carboxypeptidase regulatory-like domain/TonB dependent receptor
MFGSGSKSQTTLFCSYQQQIVMVLVALSLAAFSNLSHAQVLYGSLTGNVTDASGAAVAGAHVEATDVATGVTHQGATNGSGVYLFSDLQPDVYKVTVSTPNFKTMTAEHVLLAANTVRRMDAKLEVGQVQETVTVTGEAPELQTDKGDVHTDLSANEIGNLPITSSVGGRNFQSLLRVVPGFGLLTEQNSAAGNPQRAMSTNVNGQSLQGINTRIDGVQDAYPWLPGNVAYVPPADAIQTVNVVTNSFDAEQGMAGGAAVNVQIKSGTNQLHGEGFEFGTDNALRTRNYFQTDPIRFPVKPKNVQNQYGGMLGGPIKKDKLFFFADYQRTTQRGIGSPTETLPTTAMRTGDFSAFIPAGENCNTAANKNGCIFNPLTGLAFPGNIIPSNMIDPAAAKLMALLPALPANAPTTNNYVVHGAGTYNVDDIDAKVNYIASAKSMVFARYSISRSHILDPPALGAADGDATNGGQLGNADSRIQSVGLGATYTFTPTLLADWNFGFTRQRLGATATDIGSAYGLDTLGISGTNGFGTTGDPALYNGIPAFQTASLANIGNTNTGNPFLFRDNQYVSGANLSWNRGKHAFRFGLEYNHTQMNHFQPQGADGNFTTARGSFDFDGNLTAAAGSSPTNPANSVAQLLLGLPNRAGKATLLNNPDSLRWSQWAWYVRDQWEILPKLTVSLGVRWEYYPFGYADQGRGLPVFDPTTGNVLIGGAGNVPLDSGVSVGNGQFLPRIGFAYRLTEKTVIRGGYGMSADPNNYHYLRNAFPSTITTDPVGSSTGTPPEISLTGTNATGIYASLPVGLAPILVPSVNTSSGSVPLPNGAGTRTWPTDFRRGFINSYNLTLQQEVAGFVAEAGFVGALGVRPLSSVNINSAQICPAVLPSGLARNSADCLAGGYGRILNVNGHNWSGITAQLPFKNNYYDSLQTKLTRRLRGGSLVGLTYTFSKAINYTENEDLSGLFEHFPAYWYLDKADASFDRTHNLQIYAVYDLPFGHGQRWATHGIGNAIGGGWELNTIVSKLSGTPFSVTGQASLLNPAVQDGLNNTANLVGAYHVTGGNPWSGSGTCPLANLSCHYFDPSVFGQPTVGVFGDSRRNEFRGPGVFDADLSVFRNFKLTERFTVQFRAEAFGLTNTPRFQNPNVSCGSSTGNACSTASQTSNFGAITATAGTSGSNSSTDGARVIWFAGKLIF